MEFVENKSPDDKLKSTKNAIRQDSGMQEDLVSPMTGLGDLTLHQKSMDEDADDTMNSTCNITVIHIPPAEMLDESPKEDEEGGQTNEKLASIKENDKKDFSGEGKDSKDGSDSGVEGCAIEPQRIKDRNSIDFGLDEVSCDSSLASCCSVYEDPCGVTPPEEHPSNGHITTGECTSEAGSESSSFTGSISAASRNAHLKSTQSKKITLQLPVTTANQHTSCQGKLTKQSVTTSSLSSSTVTSSTITSRARAAAHKIKSQETNINGSSSRSQSTVRDRGRSRETSKSRSATASTGASRSKSRPDTLPSALTTEINKDLAQRRDKPIVPSKPKTRVGSRTRTPIDETLKSHSFHARTSSHHVEIKDAKFAEKSVNVRSENSRILETYATLPRGTKHRLTIQKNCTEKSNKSDAEKLPLKSNRSRSSSRDVSLNRISNKKSQITKEFHTQGNKYGLPPCPKQKSNEKTKIYHEISIQTGLTGSDIEKIFAGFITVLPNPENSEHRAKECQTENSWQELEVTKSDLKKATDLNSEYKNENEKLKSELEDLKQQLEEEKADHAFARAELDKNAQRVLAMLSTSMGTPQSDQTAGSDSFLELESQIQSSGQVVANQQLEIADLQSLCRMLSRDLEKSLGAQKLLEQQQQEMEAESAEIQDFLQEEKATLEIALREAESELKKKDDYIKSLTAEIERQAEECKHLVRISEQRRQENLSLAMKLNALERKTRELLVGQGAATSGASLALSGLANRLEALVDQLIVSYNISAKDLEDVIYHNEAYSKSNSSIDSSPVSSKQSMKDITPSPKRGSFVSAVIGAIKNAATHPFANKQSSEKSKPSDSSKQIKKELSIESSSDILDFETEPCLMMESVLEDVPLTDTYSHNMVSSCDSLRRVLSVPETMENLTNRKTKMNVESTSTTSLNNLSQAILNRRKVEDEEDEMYESISESETGPSEGTAPLTDYCPSTSLVDQVIDVDNLVTKLLKVLRIIQLDNDVCIQELKDDKSDLENKLEILLAERKITGQIQPSKEHLSNVIGEDRSSVKNFVNSGVKDIINDDEPDKENCPFPGKTNQDQNVAIHSEIK